MWDTRSIFWCDLVILHAKIFITLEVTKDWYKVQESPKSSYIYGGLKRIILLHEPLKSDQKTLTRQ